MCTAPFSTSGARLLGPLVCTRCSFILRLGAGRDCVCQFMNVLWQNRWRWKRNFPTGLKVCCDMLFTAELFWFSEASVNLTPCPPDTTFPTQFGCTASSYRECPVPTSRSANILPLMCTFTNHTIMTQHFHAVLRTARGKAVTFDPPRVADDVWLSIRHRKKRGFRSRVRERARNRRHNPSLPTVITGNVQSNHCHHRECAV